MVKFYHFLVPFVSLLTNWTVETIKDSEDNRHESRAVYPEPSADPTCHDRMINSHSRSNASAGNNLLREMQSEKDESSVSLLNTPTSAGHLMAYFDF
jgi:hypothetical protein